MSYPGFIDAGVKFSRVDTEQQLPTGTEVLGNDGAMYRYVLAGAAVTANAAVVLDSAANKVINSSAVAQSVRGVAPVAIASGSYGWIVTRGPVTVLGSTGIVAGDYLGTTATAGTVDTLTASSTVTQAQANAALAAASGVGIQAISAVSSGKVDVVLS